MGLNHLKNLEDLKSWHNMVLHLKEKYNFDNKMAIDASDALSSARVIHVLQKNSTETVLRTDLSFYQLNFTSALGDLNYTIQDISQEYKDSDDVTIPNSDKQLLNELVGKIGDGVLMMAGYTVQCLKSENKDSEIKAELKEFAEISYAFFLENIDKKEEKRNLEEEADKRNITVEELEEEKDAMSGIKLEDSKGDGKESTKIIISTEIDGI